MSDDRTPLLVAAIKQSFDQNPEKVQACEAALRTLSQHFPHFDAGAAKPVEFLAFDPGRVADAMKSVRTGDIDCLDVPQARIMVVLLSGAAENRVKWILQDIDRELTSPDKVTRPDKLDMLKELKADIQFVGDMLEEIVGNPLKPVEQECRLRADTERLAVARGSHWLSDDYFSVPARGMS